MVEKNEKSFNRIILPVDGSESSDKAVEKSLYLAKKTGLPIIALYIIDMNIYSKTLSSDQVSEQWKAILSNEGDSILKDIKKRAEKHNINVKTRILEGSPSEEIMDTAGKNDLIIMGSKGHSAFERVLVGSVSEKVLHHSDSSVMIVR